MPRQRDPSGRFVKKTACRDHDPLTVEDAVGSSDTFLKELQASWARHGAATIDQVRIERPHDYLRLMASSLAKYVESGGDTIETLSDDEIADELRQILGRLAATGADAGA